MLKDSKPVSLKRKARNQSGPVYKRRRRDLSDDESMEWSGLSVSRSGRTRNKARPSTFLDIDALFDWSQFEADSETEEFEVARPLAQNHVRFSILSLFSFKFT